MESNAPLNVGAVLFPGFELLDLFGPLEMFGLFKDGVSITMLAETPGPVRSDQGPQAIADLALQDAAGFDVLLVPGGLGTRAAVHNLTLLELIRQRAEEARFVASVCTGSALLAQAGLLDGKRATSNKRAFDWVVSQGPQVHWVRQARWVEDGQFFTSSGISAGMDMALGLIEKISGRETALTIAQRAEYVWNESRDVDPFAFPDE